MSWVKWDMSQAVGGCCSVIWDSKICREIALMFRGDAFFPFQGKKIKLGSRSFVFSLVPKSRFPLSLSRDRRRLLRVLSLSILQFALYTEKNNLFLFFFSSF